MHQLKIIFSSAKGISFLFYFIIFSCISFAQTIQDKAIYQDYRNEYYNEILKTSGEEELKAEKVFRMDLSGKNIPQSVDEFKTVWCNAPISQGNTGTCWCFSTSSFLESEVFRKTNQPVNLSELYPVYWEYVEKAKEYIKTKGTSHFSEGSETNAVARLIEKYGLVPEDAYQGKTANQTFHNHAKMFDEMEARLLTAKETDQWDEAIIISDIQSILNKYLGPTPEKFKVDGKKYTPKEYSATLKIDPKEYVNFMSLMESPYYQKAEYDVPDNWWNSKEYFNVPLDDFLNIIKHAVKNGYSVSIGGDVSEPGLDPINDVAMVPTFDIPSEYIDENARQLRFDNGSTTDDHAIHLIGYKEDENGWWFLIKDSGSGARNGKNKGYYFYHEDYIKLKMMSITLHKDAVPDEVWKKIG